MGQKGEGGGLVHPLPCSGLLTSQAASPPPRRPGHASGSPWGASTFGKAGQWLLGIERDYSPEGSWAFFWFLGDELAVFTPLMFSGKGGVLLATLGIGLTSWWRHRLYPKSRIKSGWKWAFRGQLTCGPRRQSCQPVWKRKSHLGPLLKMKSSGPPLLTFWFAEFEVGSGNVCLTSARQFCCRCAPPDATSAEPQLSGSQKPLHTFFSN